MTKTQMMEYLKLKVSFPVQAAPEYLVNGGYRNQGLIMIDKMEAFKVSPYLKKAHELLLESDPIGRIGNYKGVFELSLGVEGYTPDIGSDLGEGLVGREEMMRVIVFTTFIDATKVSEENIQKFMQALVQIHPWEAPVVELSGKGSVQLYGGKKIQV